MRGLTRQDNKETHKKEKMERKKILYLFKEDKISIISNNDMDLKSKKE